MMHPLARDVRTLLMAAAILTGMAACQPGTPVPVPDAVDSAAWAGIRDLGITDEVTGTGPEAALGKTVEVHYDGWLYDVDAERQRGARFGSSRERDRPFSFRIGAGKVIAGWEQGVAGMKVGGRRQLVIPAELGYGALGAGGGVIPPGAALIFDIELLRVE